MLVCMSSLPGPPGTVAKGPSFHIFSCWTCREFFDEKSSVTYIPSQIYNAISLHLMICHCFNVHHGNAL